MALLLIVCPRTRRSIPTNVTRRTAATMARDEARTVGPCPYCGGRHRWHPRDAFPVGNHTGAGRVKVTREPPGGAPHDILIDLLSRLAASDPAPVGLRLPAPRARTGAAA
jgi:hypothetical protein